MSLSPSAKLLLSKHSELIREILLEFKYSLGTCDIVMADVDYFLKEENNLSNNCPHCGIPTDGSSNEQCYKAPEKDWEIVSVKSFETIIEVDKNGKIRYAAFSECTIKDALTNRRMTIHSVRRLSDSEVFTVDEFVSDQTGAFKIKYFQINDDNSMTVFSHIEKDGVYLKDIRKSKPVLFKTEDGVDVREGQEFWSDIDGGAKTTIATSETIKYGWFGMYKHFSTREKAKEHILLNKPCLSVNDLCGLYSIDTVTREALISMAKQKSTK